MKLMISPEIVEMFPALRIGILVAEGIDNRGHSEDLEHLKATKTRNFRKEYTSKVLSSHPSISAWRDTYRRFGVNPKKRRPTAENLLRGILRGREIPTISKAVDLYLVVETQFCLPIGGYDLDKTAGDISLRLSPGNEDFVPLGLSQSIEQTRPEEIVYADSVRILTRDWNYRDCDECKITHESTRIALFTEAALEVISTDQLKESLRVLQNYVTRFCGGSARTISAYASRSLDWELI